MLKCTHKIHKSCNYCPQSPVWCQTATSSQLYCTVHSGFSFIHLHIPPFFLECCITPASNSSSFISVVVCSFPITSMISKILGWDFLSVVNTSLPQDCWFLAHGSHSNSTVLTIDPSVIEILSDSWSRSKRLSMVIDKRSRSFLWNRERSNSVQWEWNYKYIVCCSVDAPE